MLLFNFLRDMNVKIHIFLSPLFVNQTKIFIISYFLSIQYPNTSKENIFFSLPHLFFFSFLFPSLPSTSTKHSVKQKKGREKEKKYHFSSISTRFGPVAKNQLKGNCFYAFLFSLISNLIEEITSPPLFSLLAPLTIVKMTKFQDLIIMKKINVIVTNYFTTFLQTIIVVILTYH